MEKEEIIQLLERISDGVASENEIRQYNDWCNEFQIDGVSNVDFEKIKASMLAEIENKIHPQPRAVRSIVWPRIAVAASIICVLLLGGYLFNHQSKNQLVLTKKSEVAPGGNKAVLTLADGKTIVLNSLANGSLGAQAGSNISKPENGVLVYSAAKAEPKAVQYNTLRTPRGGKYKVVLSDGTIVWLNAASSITYPTAFNGNTRTVSITGEAYFEVIHDQAKPFTVSVMGQTIEDLGTKFDINAYGDEPVVKTTLVHGSVRVTKGSHHVLLRPGQQAVVSNYKDQITVQNVNTENEVAWVSGFMSLDNIAVKELMNRLSRWYNIDIVYSGNVPENKISGMISRKANLSDVLSVLEASGIHTRLEGKKIIVLPN
ncbi:DUF4974 domain-containing protein [Arachidicoccus ginsenosidivorans]|uniref:FecR family protein n=1 Tax=Arachidicoccus ginsenosidivorans TaxID=496057 RepID=A0A5B8VSC2_9BACT|nr:FecR family protein [Arachidicoccus ginsenosidivorans]QEC74011.1 FecR family protein [Arachidicoccus ginsenosidivorans]